MTKRFLAGAVLVLTLACSAGLAQERGNWRASSHTATAITGDLSIGDEKLVINFARFPLAQIRLLQPAEITAIFGEGSTAGTGSLYRLEISATMKFLHKNTLCGAEETQWMATSVAGKTLQVAFFSGSKMPILTADAGASSTDLCGTYSYVR